MAARQREAYGGGGGGGGGVGASYAGEMLVQRPRELVSRAHAQGSGVSQLRSQWASSLEAGCAAVPLAFLREVANDARQVSADEREARLLEAAPLREFSVAHCESLRRKIESCSRSAGNGSAADAAELLRLSAAMARAAAVGAQSLPATDAAKLAPRWRAAARWAEAGAWCIFLNLRGLDGWGRRGAAAAPATSSSSLLIDTWMTADARSKWPMLTVAAALEVLLYGDHHEAVPGSATSTMKSTSSSSSSTPASAVSTEEASRSAHVVLLYHLIGAGASPDAQLKLVRALGLDESLLQLADLCYILDSGFTPRHGCDGVAASIRRRLDSDSGPIQLRAHEELAALAGALVSRGHAEIALSLLRPVEQALVPRASAPAGVAAAARTSLSKCLAARLACDLIEDAVSFIRAAVSRCDEANAATCAKALMAQAAEHCVTTDSNGGSDGGRSNIGRLVRAPLGPLEEAALRLWLDRRKNGMRESDRRAADVLESKIIGMFAIVRGRSCESFLLPPTGSALDNLVQATGSALLPAVQQSMEVLDRGDGQCEPGSASIVPNAEGTRSILVTKSALQASSTAPSAPYLSPFVTPFPRNLTKAELELRALDDNGRHTAVAEAAAGSGRNSSPVPRSAAGEQTFGSSDDRQPALGGILGSIAHGQQQRKRKAPNAFTATL